MLFFTGWGMDADTVALPPMGCDVAVVCDYRDFELDTSAMTRYGSIIVAGWSLGVYAARVFAAANANLPICRMVAINGTLWPVDEHRGITPSIYQATADRLSESSLLKFWRRMCNDSAHYEAFLTHRPSRSVEQLRDELVAIRRHCEANRSTPATKWSSAVIGTRDRIFSPQNQRNSWRDAAWEIREVDEAHLLTDFAKLFRGLVADKKLIAKRFNRNAASYDDNAAPQRIIAEKLFGLWAEVGFEPGRDVLEIGCGTGVFTRIYLPHLLPHTLTLNDICRRHQGLDCSRYVCGDIERIDFADGEFDYVVSNASIHWLHSPTRLLRRAVRWLKPGGLLVVSTFGNRNMTEVAQATGTSLFYDSVAKLTSAIADEAEVEVAIDDTLRQEFATPLDVLHHFKATGVNAVGYHRWTKADLQRFEERYPRGEGGVCSLTFNPIYIIAPKR